MKKLLIIPLLLLFACNVFAVSYYDSKDPDSKEIDITPGNDIPRVPISRDLSKPTIEALLYCNSGNLLFTFNENIGEVTITVNDANGNVVATSTCDSSVSDSATIVVPTLAGLYTISVVGEQFSGEGSYELL